MTDIQNKLKEKFDICYVLNVSDRKDRRDNMEFQFNDIGIEDINHSDWIRYHYTTRFPYNDIIMAAFNSTKKGRFTKPNEYDCARNHYAIVKECFDRGFNHILIMEDDIKFLKDVQTLYDFINNIPNDYDILQFGGFTTDKRCLDILNKIDEFWVMHKGIQLWNASMYALSRKGMEFYIKFMNKFFWVADGPLYMAPNNDKLVNTYISTKPLVIQADKSVILSDIRDNTNDKINYNTDNMYESRIVRENYY